VDKRNTADTTVFAAEKSLKEYGDKIPAETKTAIEDKVKALNEVKGKDDADAIHKATEELSNEMMKIYEVIQKAEQEKAAGAQGAQGAQSDAGANTGQTGSSENTSEADGGAKSE
jgi:molecular chaperone DnaK